MCWHATQATITFNLFLFSCYFLSLWIGSMPSVWHNNCYNVWYLSVWLWQWPNAAFMVSKSHAIIKKIYSLAQILTRYRTYSTFLRTNKSASFITIIAFVFVVGASCCFVTSALTESCLIEDWLFPFLQTCLYTLHVIFVTSYSRFNAPECISSLMFFVQLVIAMEFMKGFIVKTTA